MKMFHGGEATSGVSRGLVTNNEMYVYYVRCVLSDK